MPDSNQSISIHAPVKGATLRSNGYRAHPRYISIHAPVKGATLAYAQRELRAIFQSTLP